MSNLLILGAPLPFSDNRRPFQVPLSKVDRVRHIVRPSLVTLPRFVQDQAKYRAILRQIGRLNGIYLEAVHPGAGPKQTRQRRAHKKSLLPTNRRTVPNWKQASADSSKLKVGPQDTETPPSQKPARGVPSPPTPVESLFHPLVPGQPPLCTVDHATNATQDSPHHPSTREGFGGETGVESIREVGVDEATRLGERDDGAPKHHDGAWRSESRETQGLQGAERISENGEARPRTRRRPSTRGVRPCSAEDVAKSGRHLNARSMAVGASGWSFAIGEDLGDGDPPSMLPHLPSRPYTQD